MLEINLEENKLTDFHVKMLFESLEENVTVKKLNLSHNYLTNISC